MTKVAAHSFSCSRAASWREAPWSSRRACSIPWSLADPGQTLHGDHACTQFQIPLHPRRFSLAMMPGGNQSGQCWETTTDGREGYQSIFLRRNFSVYIIDQPRCARAGNSTAPATLTATEAVARARRASTAAHLLELRN
jgi:hypothetical protein